MLSPEPTEADFTLMILQEIGKPNDTEISALVSLYLAQFRGKARVSPYLQKLYAKREVLSLLISQNVGQLTSWTEAGVTESHGNIGKSYADMQTSVQAQIDSVEKQAGSTLGCIGQLVTTVPAPSPACRFPANSPLLIGDPNYPRFWRR